MAGRPDFDVVVGQEYIDKKTAESKTRWYKVGAGWTNKKGISFNICTLPGVSLSLFPVKEADKPEPTSKSKQASRANNWHQSDEDTPF